LFLTDQDVVELTAWRRKLHRMPEVSREEAGTARAVVAFVSSADADRIITDLGGNGPMRASEDFGRFGDAAAAAMFFLGAGEHHPSLHNPDYDFPDDLIAIGARVFMRTLRDLLG
jgi:metal-dependent amidase/aminoacylase/carboxypeptidase family protein